MLDRLLKQKVLDHIIIEKTRFSVQHTVRKNMKRFILRVMPNRHLHVSSPKCSVKRVERFILDNSAWIVSQQVKIRDPYAQGEDFFYLGKAYKIIHRKGSFEFHGDVLYLDPDSSKTQCDSFYKTMARTALPERVEYWENKMDVKVKGLGFRLAKARWGSCNASGRISLNPYMMKLPSELIDYIVVHELSHLSHLNHSPAFYERVEAFLPNYKSLEAGIRSFTLGSQGL